MYKFIIILAIFIIACSNDRTQLINDTILRYSVSTTEDSLVIGGLNYKETKVFDPNDRLIIKKVFDIKGNLKGSEKLMYSTDKATSEYRLVDNSLQSYYEYKFENNFLLEKRSYDASNNELLRIEQYNYDDDGNQIEKIIMTANEIISRVYKFAFDEYGNELGFSVYNENGKMLLLETYKITEMDDSNKWIKKWAERDSTIKAYYERTIEKY